MTARLRVAHTADLAPHELRDVRRLLEDAFAGGIDDSDYEHALGGLHALLVEDDELVGHGAVVLRRLLHDGRALRTGYVEAVAVRADRRGRGHGAAVMGALERVVQAAYEVGALGSSDEALGFYAARGWVRWRGPTSAITPRGLRRTPDDDGGVFVLPVAAPLDPDGDLACDWRDGDVW